MTPRQVTRRTFLTSSIAFTYAALAGSRLSYADETEEKKLPGLQLDPRKVPKFVNALPNPLAPEWLVKPDSQCGTAYTLTIQQTSQSLGLGGNLMTTVWGYASQGRPASYPGPTFDIQQGSPVTVTYVNGLQQDGLPIQNPMPVDTTLDWANPGGLGGLAPVPVATHLHGGDSAALSDGLPDAWATPGDAITGRLFAKPYTYDNSQEAGHLWYHDHALGITRTNVYMGLAGLYFIRDDNENRLRASNVLPSGNYEVPLVIQDRMFNSDGSLHYPSTPAPVPGFPNPPAQSHLPEFFGDIVLVNTQAWPVLQVEPRKYRFRFLNGSDSRFYELKLGASTGGAAPALLVIGNELGLLDTPAYPSANQVGGPKNVLAIAPGERYDVIIDFSGLRQGTRLILRNSAGSPYPDGDHPAGGLTDRVMAFDVVLPLNAAVPNASVAGPVVARNGVVTPGTALRSERLPPVTPPASAIVRKILLFEGVDKYGRLQTMLGTLEQGTLTFRDPVTEQPAVGSTEIWEFYNTTVDAHPIHMHLVDFRVLNREAFTGFITPKTNSDGSEGGNVGGIQLGGAPRLPGAWESGKKDTVQAFPGEVTRVLVSFKRPGEYVYHCHILSHEDHEMMRPYRVGNP